VLQPAGAWPRGNLLLWHGRVRHHQRLGPLTGARRGSFWNIPRALLPTLRRLLTLREQSLLSVHPTGLVMDAMLSCGARAELSGTR
jgi:hypothetical protein